MDKSDQDRVNREGSDVEEIDKSLGFVGMGRVWKELADLHGLVLCTWHICKAFRQTAAVEEQFGPQARHPRRDEEEAQRALLWNFQIR